MCFLAVIGCLRPTNDFETLTKDPKLVFQFVKDKISGVNGDRYDNIADFSPWELKHLGLFLDAPVHWFLLHPPHPFRVFYLTHCTRAPFF